MKGRAFFSRKRVAIPLGIVAFVAAASTAFAFWTGTGSGEGTASVGNGGTVTLTATVASGIAPGTSRPVLITGANGGGSAVQVGSVHLASVGIDGGHTGCATSDFSMQDVVENHQVPAGASAEPMPNAGTVLFANSAVNQDACKGATITLTFSAS